MNIDLKARAVLLALHEGANESLGIYPQSVVGGDNPYEKRTEWMEGWNAAVTANTRAMCEIEKWYKSVPTEFKPVLDDLLVTYKVQITKHDDAVTMYVNCNDLFWWAVADAEELNFSDLAELNRCISESPDHGELLWCAKKRKMRPQKPYYKSFSNDEAELFNACGPERDE